MSARKVLGERRGERFEVTATVERFGHRNGYRGPEETVLLRDVRDATTGELLTDHLWFTVGKWAADLQPGGRIRFTARATPYEKGYFGRREDVALDRPAQRDWRLARPTQVQRIPEAQS